MKARSFLATRRAALGGIGAGLIMIATGPKTALGKDDEVMASIREATGGAPLNDGRVELELPPVAESGNSVPVTVRVQCAMTPEEYVRRILIFSDRNPRPRLLSVMLGPRAGKAELATNIRLNGTQNVIAVAELSDGSYWTQKVSVLVIVGACDALMMRY